MRLSLRIAIVLVVLTATLAVILWPQPDKDEFVFTGSELPRLLDIGSTTCIPCKKMAPILNALAHDYVGVFEVEFLDTRVNKELAEEFGIRLIPTQIFFNRQGLELYRHEGFMGREEILDTWIELGLDLTRGDN
jgi:thiol-disulfide isomerase/thioredoxin